MQDPSENLNLNIVHKRQVFSHVDCHCFCLYNALAVNTCDFARIIFLHVLDTTKIQMKNIQKYNKEYDLL